MTSIYSAASSPSLPSRAPSRNGQASAYASSSTSSRPMLDRMPSTISDMPVATNSALNKVGSASSSLYQNCRSVLAQLYRVPGFAERFIDDAAPGDGPDAVASVSSDPVSRSLHALRLGSSLCYLFNALDLAHKLDVSPAATRANLKACQRGTAHFIMACKQDLGWLDQDLFAIHELYGQDTNGVVKVINTVTKLLSLLEQQGLLDPVTEAPADVAGPSNPSDERGMVVKEILDSERKYVQDLEVLQDYQRQVASNDIITQDQIHNLFLNLNSLADFQRRFLIGVEANASLTPEQQHFGHLFLTMTLLKNTPESSPAYPELAAGLASIERVTARVNETTRREDNRLAVIDLQRRVEDWKGHDITSFGELLLKETFFVIKSDSEREYSVYLFERIILCCKESGASGKKSSKSNSILKRPASRRIANLQLKGRIFVNNVTAANNVSRNGQCLLEVRWRGDVAEEAFTIKCRTEELLKQWQRTIQRAVDENPSRRRANHLSGSARRSDRGFNSPLSQFPGTPMSEAGPSSASIHPHHSHYSHPSESGSTAYAHSSNTAQPPYPPQHNGFDDEGDEPYDPSESGRSTPSQRRGMGRDSNGQSIQGRPRANTQGEDSSSAINQWRSQTPNDGYHALPSIPRTTSHVSNGSESQSLRSSASSRQLRTKQSTEWGNTGSPGPSPAMGYSKLPMTPADEDATPRQGVLRQTSHASVPTHPQPPPMRNRSASSPNIYQVSPTLEQGGNAEWGNAYAGQQQQRNGNGYAGGYGQHVPKVPSLSMSHKGGGTNSAGTLASASSASTNKKRFSSSSNGTDRSSGTSSQSAGQGQISPASTQPPSAGLPPLPANARGYASPIPGSPGGASAVRVKVTYGDDTFVVVVLSSVSYPELVDKVLKKIRLCGVRSMDATSLRLRYQDEDGDRILITSEEDVMMAFEAVRAMSSGPNQTLVLFATVDS
ncbi:cell division control protein 24 [Pseudohyphozyma bogoriensis]|nr:cell division control protein 24 [Pseudohyphozyma bogoriensis]